MSNKAAWRKFEATMKEKRVGKRGNDVLKNERLTVQRLSAEVSGRAQKYSRMGPREFVPFEFEEVSIKNIKTACMQYFSDVVADSMECDILAGEQGPSCTSLDQVPDVTKVVHVRFIHSDAAGTEDRLLEVVRPQKPRKSPSEPPVAKKRIILSEPCQEGSKPGPSNTDTYPKSLSVVEMLKLGKVINDKCEEIELSSFSVEDMRWCSKPITAEFIIEEKSFGKGGFRVAFKAKSYTPGFKGKTWVVKKYLNSSIEGIKRLGQEVEQQTKKVVQMHMLAQNMCLKLEQELKQQDVLEEYGSTLKYNVIFLGRFPNEIDDHQWVTVEEFIEGDFQKYMNNNGMVCGPDCEIRQKCESLAHFSFELSVEQLMIVDMQGSGHTLFDPEIASTVLQTDGEVLFSAGNLSKQAINNFIDQHNCNDYCKILGLQEIKKDTHNQN